MPAQNIALIGANSSVGPAILEALLSSTAPRYSVTVITRSTSKPIKSHPQIRVVIASTKEEYIAVLNDQDVLISALRPNNLEIQMILVDACTAAHVSRYIIADFGSFRSDQPYLLDVLFTSRNKERVRNHCIRFSEDYPWFTWSSLVTGHFFDYGLRSKLLGFDLKTNKVKLFDKGQDKFSTSTVGQVGKGVLGILNDLEGTKNKMMLMQSFCVSQIEMLECLKRLGRRFEVIDMDSKEVIHRLAEKMGKSEDGETLEELAGVLGMKRSNWTRDPDFSNGLLGLEEEDLEEVVRSVLEDL